MRIDIALQLFNRPRHALEVVSSLEREGVERVRVFVDHSDVPGVQAQQEAMLEAMHARAGIAFDVHRHARHQGLAASVRFAVDTSLADADAVIVLEDDCVVRPGGIRFFTEALHALRENRTVRSVCGYLFPCDFVSEPGRPLLLRRFCPWGWATWRDRWSDYDPNLRRAISRLEAAGIPIDDLGEDLAALCRSWAYLENRVDVWSVPWTLDHYAMNGWAVYPTESVIDNIGFDGTGLNCWPSTAFTAAEGGSAPEWDFARLHYDAENDGIVRGFMDRNGAMIYPRV